MRQLKITKSITNRESASLDKYLQEIGKEELITVEEEVELAQRIRKGDQEINDGDNRSRKIWLLLAYMIYCRARTISQEELVNLLWSDDEGSSNPLNALKTMFHRLRTMLSQLDGFSGYDLIIRQNGSYAWNTEIPVTLDVDRFEQICKDAAACEEEE